MNFKRNIRGKHTLPHSEKDVEDAGYMILLFVLMVASFIAIGLSGIFS